MSEQQPTSSKPESASRPPDFVLPKLESAGARRRPGEPEIYLSWGGEIYGPAAADDVLAGVRASYYEEGALYWFEGQSEWLPVSGFPEIAPTLTARRNFASVEQPADGVTHGDPGVDDKNVAGGVSPLQKRPKIPRAPRAKGDYRGIGIVIAFVLLAVGLTVGILLLLHIFMRG